MDDVTPELWERILRLYESGKAANPKLEHLLRLKEKTYTDAQAFAIANGKNASRALQTVLTQEALPDGRMYFNIAERTVRPLLELLFEDVANFCGLAQEQVNAAAGIGLKPVRPKLNDSRVRGIIDRMTEAEKFEDVAWIQKAPVVNFSQAVVDDSVRENADFQSKAGLRPKIARTSPQCCDWCDKLIGVYDYPPENEEVWQRHDNCTCELTYYPTEGASQNPWGNRVGGLTRKTEERMRRQGTL